jgi:hypothetical protein
MNTTTAQLQISTLTAATATGNIWTSQEIRTLEILKNRNLTISDIATQLHRTYYSVSTKLNSIGFATPHKISNTPKIKIAICSVCFTTPAKSGLCLC